MWTTIETPVGELRLVSDGEALTAIDFLGDMPQEQSRSVARAAGRAAAAVGEQRDDVPVLHATARQLAEYFAGEREEFDLPLAPQGTFFQRRVWEELQRIAYGTTTTYGGLAAALGLTGHGARAVGMANGRNPIPIVVPCHRVVGADGSLTGYAGGTDRKRALLDLEQGTPAMGSLGGAAQ